jgi:hypothetical protein
MTHPTKAIFHTLVNDFATLAASSGQSSTPAAAGLAAPSVTALSLHCHCTVTALSLHCHCTVTALSLHCHCTVTALPLCKCFGLDRKLLVILAADFLLTCSTRHLTCIMCIKITHFPDARIHICLHAPTGRLSRRNATVHQARRRGCHGTH